MSVDTQTDADMAQLREASRAERVERVFRVEPTDYQAVVLNYGAEKPRAQTAPKKGRQVGATLTAGMIGADHALAGPRGTDVLYAAPSQGTSNEMFRECKKLFWNADLSLSQFGVISDNKETWEFADGTRILSQTLGNVEQTNNSGNRGMNPTCVIVDEAAYEKDAVYTEEIEEFFITHEEFEYHLFSTPAGQSGYFYEKVEQSGHREVADARTESLSWFAPYWPTRISPFAQEDYIEKKREELDEDTFAQEFLGEFVAGGSVIDGPTYNTNVTPDREFSQSAARYLGVDVAGGGDDRLVIVDLDEHGVVHNIWAWAESSGPEFLSRLTEIVTGWPPEPEAGTGERPDEYQAVVVERNGIGEFAADFAERDLGDVIVPVSSGNESKHTLYKRLIRDFEAGELGLPEHARLRSETLALEKETTPTGYWKVSHPSGGHDDYPDALMLANGARHGLASEFEQSLKGESTTVVRTNARAAMNKRR